MNDLTIYNDENAKESMIGTLTNEKVTMFTSMSAETVDEKKALFNAMNNPQKRVADMIGKEIAIRDVFVESVDMVNEETGEVTIAPRIVLVDTKGVSYQCVSTGIFSALKKLFQIFGMPTWENGIKTEVAQIQKGKRNILTLRVI